MELSTGPSVHIAVVLGVDLQLVVVNQGRKFTIRALNGDGNVLQVLGATAEPPSDGVLAAARATAIMLFPDRITEAIQLPEPPPPAIRPHAYERGWECKVCGGRQVDHPSVNDHDYARGWHCAHCPQDARHPIHDKSNRAGAAL